MFVNIVGGLMSNIMENPQNIENAIDALLMSTKGITEGELFSRSKEGIRLDLLIKRIRHILVQIVRGEAAIELKGKCVELLMRIGLAAGSPEDLILAA